MEKVEKKIVNVLTENQGKFMTSLSLEEVVKLVKECKGGLLKLPLLNQPWKIGIDFNAYDVTIDTVRHLDLSEIKIVGYEEITHRPLEVVSEEVDETEEEG